MSERHSRTYVYDGTIQGFEWLVYALGYGVMWHFNLHFLTNDGQPTWMFTGIVQLGDGRVLREGDHYQVDCRCDEE